MCNWSKMKNSRIGVMFKIQAYLLTQLFPTSVSENNVHYSSK